MVCKQNEAKVHLTQVVEGNVKKLDLCEACAKVKGVDDPTGFSLADLLMGLGASQELSQSGGAAGAACPICGLTQADFKKTGRLGCPGCYDAFAEGLQGLLKSMHKGTRHVGKRPGQSPAPTLVTDDLAPLRERLAEAIRLENYEEAARLRDEIKAAQSSAQPGG
jgi:protein arginine kinase activator